MADKNKDVEITELTEYSDHEDNETNNESNQKVDQNKKEDRGVFSFQSASFKDLHLRPELLRAITDCGFEHPSEVQHQCIPQAILGTDVLCQAKSGMGKTAVFVLSVLQQLQVTSTSAGPLCLVLCHTRELAYQISKEFDRFRKYLPDVKTGVFYGGMPVAGDREKLKDEKNIPHIVIGTPGRILQLSEEKALPLKNLKFFVLDECDKMLEQLDMRRDVQNIFKLTPHDKQVMMFTATLSETIRPICKKFMHNPLEIYINDGSKLTLHGLKQYYVRLDEKEKNRKLVDLLDALEFNQVVIFVRTSGRAEALNKLLSDCNFPSITIHADLQQEDRIDRYNKFKNFQSRIMVATNLFGRGIDIERVNVVINYDMSESSDTYLHRVGRAGRFGTKGLAISFVTTPKDDEILADVQKRFVVSVPELPNEIDASSYMNA